MKSFAITLLLIGATIAQENQSVCDPYIDSECLYKPPPENYMGWYYSHGALSWVQTFFMGGMLIAYQSALEQIGTQAEAISYAIIGLNFIGYFIVAVKWSISANETGTVLGMLNKYKRYYKLLRISNFYTWFLSLINLGWFTALILQVLIYHTFPTGTTKPSIWIPVIGLSVEVVLRFVYSFSQYYSSKLMKCWAYDWPELGKCTFTADEPGALEGEDASSL